MNLNDYQKAALGNRSHDCLDICVLLGLPGEVGEVMELFKKHYRGDKPLCLDSLRKELGDVLWYLSAIADENGLTLEEVAQGNLDKLADRKARGKIKGSGDNR